MASLFYQNMLTDRKVSMLTLNSGLLFLLPLERIKIILQASPKNPHNQTKARFYAGFFDCFKKVIKREGFFSLYRGISLHLIFFNFFLYNRGIFNFSLENLHPDFEEDQLNLYQDERNIDLLERRFEEIKKNNGNFFGGFLTFFLLANPLSVIRVNQSMYVERRPEKRPFKGLFDTCSKIYRKYGIKGFYRGLLPQMSFYFPIAYISHHYTSEINIRQLRADYNEKQPQNDNSELKPFLEFCDDNETIITGFGVLGLIGMLWCDNMSVRRMVVNMSKFKPKDKAGLEYSFWKDFGRIGKVSGWRHVFRGGLLNVFIMFGVGLSYDFENGEKEEKGGDGVKGDI